MIVFFLAVNDQFTINGLLFVPADPQMMGRFSRSKGKLTCHQVCVPQNKKYPGFVCATVRLTDKEACAEPTVGLKEPRGRKAAWTEKRRTRWAD